MYIMNSIYFKIKIFHFALSPIGFKTQFLSHLCQRRNARSTSQQCQFQHQRGQHTVESPFCYVALWPRYTRRYPCYWYDIDQVDDHGRSRINFKSFKQFDATIAINYLTLMCACVSQFGCQFVIDKR